MLINYDTAKIKEFLKDFYNITGLTVSIWDTDINQLGHQPDVMPDFCRLVRSSKKGRERCLMSDKSVCSICRNTLKAATHQCHAGLNDTAIPITLDGKLFGFMMFGQIRGTQKELLPFKHFQQLAQELSLSAEALHNAYNNLKTFDIYKIESAAKILISAAGYLFDSSSIQYTENELVTGIDTYIKNNISQPISIAEICAYFMINRTRLYELSNKYYGMPIGKYISKKRVKKAKALLESSELPIYAVSESVGIPDYNYFTKVFKKYYGMTPKEYKKNNMKHFNVN